jgi:PAS domain S-box-containing protein
MFELEDIIKSSHMFLVAKDQNFKFTYCNEKFAEAIGLDSPKQIIGKTDYDLFTPPYADVYRAGDISVINGNNYLNIQELQPQQGSLHSILTSKSVIRNNESMIKGLVVSYVDITHLPLKESTLKPFQFNECKQTYTFKIGNLTEYFTLSEYTVYKHVLLGLTAKQIAKKMLLSPRTVEQYIDRIKKKLQCSSKHNILEAAMRYGLVNSLDFALL